MQKVPVQMLFEFLNDSTMSSASATSVPSSLSVKEYVDSRSPVQIRVSYSVPSGTLGPGYTAGSWQTISLNTIDTDTSDSVTISSNMVTIPAGKYYVAANAYLLYSAVGNGRLRLYNNTNSTVLLQGVNSRSAGNNIANSGFLDGFFEIATDSQIALQSYTAVATTGAASTLSTGAQEVFTILTFLKLG